MILYLVINFTFLDKRMPTIKERLDTLGPHEWKYLYIILWLWYT